jgi:hypothetical protein
MDTLGNQISKQIEAAEEIPNVEKFEVTEAFA